MNEEIIIALIGPIAAGKGTAAEILIQKGYFPFNYGDVIYKERTAQGLREERKISNAVGAELRLLYGKDTIAKRIGEAIQLFREQKKSNKILIDGLRHPDEVAWVIDNLNAKVIGINASPEIRFERALKRNRDVDPKSPEVFLEVDLEDRTNISEHGNQTDKCLQLAHIVIENNDENIEEYKSKFYKALKDLNIDINS